MIQLNAFHIYQFWNLGHNNNLNCPYEPPYPALWMKAYEDEKRFIFIVSSFWVFSSLLFSHMASLFSGCVLGHIYIVLLWLIVSFLLVCTCTFRGKILVMLCFLAPMHVLLFTRTTCKFQRVGSCLCSLLYLLLRAVFGT
jgi:hypothetical protein